MAKGDKDKKPDPFVETCKHFMPGLFIPGLGYPTRVREAWWSKFKESRDRRKQAEVNDFIDKFTDVPDEFKE